MKMKRLLFFSFVALLFSSSILLAQASGSYYSFNQNLTIGSSGADVIALQQLLIGKGFLTIISTPTGYFGIGTQTALGKFQAANGIYPASGYFGSKSRAFVNSLNVSSQSITVPQNTVSNNTVSNQAATPPPITNACNGTLCNGTCYNSCPSGQDFVCPATGGQAYCQTNQQQQANSQKAAAIASYEAELQTYNNAITQDQNQITAVQAQSVQSCAAMMNTPLSEAFGVQGAQAIEQAQICNSYEQEISSIAQNENQIEQEETSVKNEILYIESLP